jgi:hypothetical protein
MLIFPYLYFLFHFGYMGSHYGITGSGFAVFPFFFPWGFLVSFFYGVYRYPACIYGTEVALGGRALALVCLAGV